MRFLLLLCLIPFAALAESGHGFAVLALQHDSTPCKPIVKYARKAPAPYLSFLLDSFGTSKACARAYTKAAAGKTHFLQVYLSNEVCRRKGNCAPYEFLANLSVGEYNSRLERGDSRVITRVVKQARKAHQICEGVKNDRTKCLLAIGLESQYTEGAARAISEAAVSAGWPREALIHNPVNTGPYQGYGGAHYYESHGLHAPTKERSRGIVTLDGETPDLCPPGGATIGSRISNEGLQSWSRSYQARAAFIAAWCPAHQGLRADSSVAPKPRSRVLRLRARDFTTWLRVAGAGELPSVSVSTGAHNEKGCTRIVNFRSGNTVVKESDHGGVVVVFDEHLPRYSRVRIVEPSGKATKLDYTGTGNPIGGIPRHHFRKSSRPWATFARNSVLKAKKKKRVDCWKFQESGRRYEG